MDYLSMSDEKFIFEILKLHSNNGLDVLEFLKNNEEIVLRIKKCIDEHIVSAGNLIKFRNLYKSYESYLYVIKFLDILENSDSYDSLEKLDFLLSEKKSFSFKYFPSCVIDKINFVLKNKSFIQNVDSYIFLGDKSYSEVLGSFKKIINYYKMYDDIAFYSYVSSFYKEEECKKICSIILRLYFQSLINGSNSLGVDILNIFSFDDIFLIDKLNFNVRNIDFCVFRFVPNIFCRESDLDDLFAFLDDLNIFFKSGKEVDFFVWHMVKDLNISFDVFESRYLPVLKQAIHLGYFYSYDGKKKYSDVEVCKFMCVLDVYRSLTKRSDRMIKIILNNDNLGDFYNMVYEIKYFNNITPFSNKSSFFERVRNYRSNDKLLNFIDGYEKYYNNRKQNEKAAEEERLITEKFNKVDLYVSYIRNFIDGGYDKLDIYFYDFSIDKKDFYDGLEFLKEINHPILEEYTSYIDCVKRKRFSLLIKSARVIVNGIKNGIKLSDGSVRKFDLIDYYSYTHMEIFDFLKFMSKVCKESNNNDFSMSDYRIVVNALGKFKDIKPIGEKGLQILLDGKNIYAIDSDNTYEATIDDKNNVLLILNERGIPVNSVTFSIMLRRYVFDNYSNDKTKKIG